MNEHIAQELSILYEGQAVSLPKRRQFKSVVDHRLSSNKAGSQAFWRSHTSGAKYTRLFEAIKDTKSMSCSRTSCVARIKILGWLKISDYSIPVTAWAIAFTHFIGVEDVPFFMILADPCGSCIDATQQWECDRTVAHKSAPASLRQSRCDCR